MTKVCAFMSLFNEEDIIEETVAKMIANDVDIFVIDNGCTDGTISKIQKYLGRGVIDIVEFITEEDGRKVFRLQDILEQFEVAAKKLNYDWYLISDADEIKYSPWASYSLQEGIARVDRSGYSLINFKLFNFRPINEDSHQQSLEGDLTFYAEPDPASAIQMKCWKKSDAMDIKAFGGHIVSIENPMVFPVRFINKHYPIRSYKHGIKKIKDERIARYSPAELKKGWHSHYLSIDFNSPLPTPDEQNKLRLFDLHVEQNILLDEAVEGLMCAGELTAAASDEDLKHLVLTHGDKKNYRCNSNFSEIYDIAKKIYEISGQYVLPPIEVSENDLSAMKIIIDLLRLRDNFTGNLLRANRSEKIKLVAVK